MDRFRAGTNSAGLLNETLWRQGTAQYSKKPVYRVFMGHFCQLHQSKCISVIVDTSACNCAQKQRNPLVIIVYPPSHLSSTSLHQRVFQYNDMTETHKNNGTLLLRDHLFRSPTRHCGETVVILSSSDYHSFESIQCHYNTATAICHVRAPLYNKSRPLQTVVPDFWDLTVCHI